MTLTILNVEKFLMKEKLTRKNTDSFSLEGAGAEWDTEKKFFLEASILLPQTNFGEKIRRGRENHKI